MIATNEAIALVRRNGSQLDQLRLRNALGQPFPFAEAVEILTPYQFPDGSWDYEAQDEARDTVGSLGGTIHCLRWVREFGLGDTRMMASTIEFLEFIQSPDGSFYETEEKLAHSPQGWLQQETLIDRFYFTATVPMRLLSLDHGGHPVVEPAIEWLEHHWTNWELVTGTWYNVWTLLCIYPEVPQLSATQYQRCYAKALDWLPWLDARPLTWLLDALHGAGYSTDEPLVTKGMARLLALLDENSVWSDTRHSTVETTVTAVRLMHDYRRALALGE